MRSGHFQPEKRVKTPNGATRTNTNAGRMCASVKAACEENALSSTAICGGPLCEGEWSANMRRITTAIAITMQIQKPVRIHMGERSRAGLAVGWGRAVIRTSGSTLERHPKIKLTICQIKLES